MKKHLYIALLFLLIACNYGKNITLNYFEYDIGQIKISCPDNWIKKDVNNAILALKLDTINKNRYFIIMKIPKMKGMNTIEEYVCMAHEELKKPHKYIYKGVSLEEVTLNDNSITYAGYVLTEYENEEFISMDSYTEDENNIYKLTLNVKKNELTEFSEVYKNILSSFTLNNRQIFKEDVLRIKKVNIDKLCNN